MLDHRQVSQLVVIAPVTVISCICSPPQRIGARCHPVWPMHSNCRGWNYIWTSLTSNSSSPCYHVSPVAILCRNWLWGVMHQVCSQGVQHTLVCIPLHRLSTIRAYVHTLHTRVSWKCMVFCLTGVCVVQCARSLISFIECCGLYR